MSTAEIILTAILILCSAVLAVLGVCQLQCKGYCFNNAYIFASEKEREALSDLHARRSLRQRAVQQRVA